MNEIPYRDGEAIVPGFQTGGVVREGEWILPVPGSEARIEPGGAASGGTVEYHFPVEVVVAGAMSEAEVVAIERRIFGALAEALDRIG